jgi:hypothetical protein
MIKAGKLVFLLSFFALLIQSLYFFSDKPDELMAMPLILLLAGGTAFFLGRTVGGEDSDFQVNIFLWAFSIRLWMGIIFYGWDLTGVFGDEDAASFMFGWELAENWYLNGIDGFISDLSMVVFERQNLGQGVIWGIPMFIAGGPSRMIVSTINSFAGSLLVIVIFRISRRVFDSATARIAAVLVTFWASIILLSAGTSKEMLVIFFEWTLLYLLIRSPSGVTPRDGLLALPSLLALSMMRFYALYMVAAAFIFRFIVARREHIVRNVVFGSMVVGSVLIFLNAGGVITRDFARLERQNRNIESWRENVADNTGTGVEIYSEYESTTVAIPVATVYFFLAPFPWDAFGGTLRNAFGAVENIFVYIILILGFPAIKIFFKDRFIEMAPIFVFCVLYAGLHIWGLSNVGLAWRHKQTVMPLFFMLVAVAITQRRAAWQLISSRQTADQKGLSIIKAG